VFVDAIRIDRMENSKRERKKKNEEEEKRK
jgi:hypothetical protein